MPRQDLEGLGEEVHGGVGWGANGKCLRHWGCKKIDQILREGFAEFGVPMCILKGDATWPEILMGSEERKWRSALHRAGAGR